MQFGVHALANSDLGHIEQANSRGLPISSQRLESKPSSLCPRWFVSLPTTDSPIRAPCSRRLTSLDGGLRVRLRLTRPSDAAHVRGFLERLSPETRQRRFLSPMPSVPQAVVDHFTFYDPRERLVIAATMPGQGGEEIVGLGDVSFLSTGIAEIGLVVEEEHQSRGIGRLIAEADRIARAVARRDPPEGRDARLEPGRDEGARLDRAHRQRDRGRPRGRLREAAGQDQLGRLSPRRP